MVKPKHRIFCHEAGKSKMLFETEKKALGFIKFNTEEVMAENGYSPCRAYYCVCCGGWHVTHNEGNSSNVRSTEAVVERYRSVKKKKEIFESEEALAKQDAAKHLVELLQRLCKYDNDHTRPSVKTKSEMTAIWRKYAPECHAINTKRILELYFEKFQINH